MQWLLMLFLSTLSLPASAHVKWFSNYDFQQRPLNFSELNTPVFWGLFILSIFTIVGLVYLDKLAEKSQLYLKVNGFLDRYADQGPIIMRVAMGAVLLMSWQGDTVIAPEIAIQNPIWGWFQFLLALFLLFKETTPLAGLGIIFLYFKGIDEHGFFHMLDYVVYPAVGLFLILSYQKIEKLKNLDLPVLYSGLGFSLCWVAFEKMIYPYWGISVLAQQPALTMGLRPDFFLLSCAFVEFSLGYLLIICLLHRPLAIIVTLTFFTTTAFFGKTEVVGHTILHGALLVFIVKGPGHYYQAPVRFHKNFWLRSLFSAVNFVILFVILAIPYQKLSQNAFETSLAKRALEAHPRYEVPTNLPVPKVTIHAFHDAHGGWNIHLMTSDFKFTPENSGKADIDGEGHAHLFLNGKKIARVYGNWFHVSIPKGKNSLKVNLTTNSHKDYYHQGQAIESETELDESREVSIQHAH
jgi:uncharacterized membrane protein YphA (DoxX/SURF4 family)